MKVSTPDGKRFTLTRETDADRQLIDALDIERCVFVEGVVRRSHHNEHGGVENNCALLLVSRNSQEALRAKAGRQALSALGELLRLGLGEAAQHRHVGATAADPQAYEQRAAVAVELQAVLQTLCGEVVQQETVPKEMVRAHGVSPKVETATVAQGGAA